MFIRQISSLLRHNKFYFLGILLFSGILLWLSHDLYQGSVSLYSEAENSINQLQNKRKSISGMMRFARERSIILLKMNIEPDLFERYTIRQQMTEEALNFVNAKDDYEKTILSAQEKQLFDEIFEIVRVTAPIQLETAELMIADEMGKANKLLFGQALPNQALIMQKYNDLLQLVEVETDEEVSKMKALLGVNNQNVIFLIFLVISGTVTSFILIIIHSARRENKLKKLVDERTNELHNANIRNQSLIENASDGIICIDQKQNIVVLNPAAEKMFQYNAEEALGQPLSILLPEKFRDSHPTSVKEFERDDTTQSRMMDSRPEVLGQRKDGTVFPVEVSISKSRIGNKMFFTAFLRDVTEKRENEEKIRKLAMFDSLTGLYNRHHFENRVNESINYQNRFPSQGFCLMLLDLDLFKQVNDTYGHPVGDKLLKLVADTLKNSVREVDDIGRLGGDEFALLLQGVKEPEYAIKIAEKIIFELSQPQTIENYEIKIGVSIGATFRDQLDTTAEALFKEADKMLYASKNAGKNTYRVFRRN